MTLERTGIFWIGASREPSHQGRVSRALFTCNENVSDIVRAEITCEDADSVYSFTLLPANLGYEGECSIWSSATHTFKGKQEVRCSIVNGTEGNALLLSGTPMEAHGRGDLYWMIRIEKVKREFNRIDSKQMQKD